MYGNIKITCNFSRITLSSNGVPDYIKNINRKYNLDYSAVMIEITDDCISPDFELSKNNIKELKNSGFGICLDDFGKAFTSLSDISGLYPDVIKIDKTMLYNAKDDQGRLVFENIVQLAKKMNSTVLCEGVETMEQKKAVKAAGCEIMQGFYFYNQERYTVNKKRFNILKFRTMISDAEKHGARLATENDDTITRFGKILHA